MLEFANHVAAVTVDLENGGRISSLRVRDHELLVAQSDDRPESWGSYPMVPFAGRVRNGEIDLDGEIFHLPATAGPHAIHGYGHLNAWHQIDDVTIGWEFTDPWPWAGRATQRFELCEDRLDLRMAVTADERQPVCFGWHPWFVKRLDSGHDLELEFEPTRMYERGDDHIPTGRLIDPPPGPWDDCFVSVTPIRLRWGPVELELSASTEHWVVFDEPEHATCVEPQTGPPNDVNFAPLVLEADETATLDFIIRWENRIT